jgi:uncharacterized protein YcfJ
MIKYTLFAMVLALPAYADGFDSIAATVVAVKAKYETTYEYQDVQVCQDVSVPVYGQYIDNPSDGDVAAGAIIGGAIGNQFGEGDGKTAMTILGAIVGANHASRPRVHNGVTGYTVETQCHYETQEIPTTVRTGYVVTYEQHGYFHKAFMTTKPRIGSTIKIKG